MYKSRKIKGPKLRLPTQNQPPSRFDFSLVGANLVSTESILQQCVQRYDKAKEDSVEHQDLMAIAIKSLALSRLAYSEDREDPVTEAHCRISEAYLLGGMNTQAMQHAYEAMNRSKVTNAPISYKVLLCLGRAYMASGDNSRAKDIFSETLKVVRTKMGEQSIEQCAILCEIAEVLWRQDKHSESIDTLGDVWMLQEAKFGSDAPELLPTYLLLGQAYSKMKDFKSAQEQLERAFRIAESKKMTETKSYAKACVLFATCCFDPDSKIHVNDEKETENEKKEGKEGGAIRALKYYVKAVTIYEQIFGKHSQEVIGIYRNMTAIYIGLENFAEGVKCMSAVLEGMQSRFGPSSLEVAVALKRIGEMLTLDNRITEAKTYLKKALETLSVLPAKRHSSLMSSIRATLVTLKSSNHNISNYAESPKPYADDSFVGSPRWNSNNTSKGEVKKSISVHNTDEKDLEFVVEHHEDDYDSAEEPRNK